MHAKLPSIALASIAAFSGFFGFLAGQWAAAREPTIKTVQLLSTGTTATGAPITYPAGRPAAVSAVILTLQPGDQTGWHQHNVPGFGYMLEGQVTVDYQGFDSRTYRSGDALIEAVGVGHNGVNTGSSPARILAVFMGADGIETTEQFAK
jgi:quercetin dioxygenase-like cupin family protein